MTSAVNFAIHERDGAGARLALSCGALGDVRRAPRIIKYDAARRAFSGKMEFPPGTDAFEMSVYRAVGGVWGLRGSLRVDMCAVPAKRAGARPMAEIAGTPGEPGPRLLAPPTVEVWRSSAAAPAAAARAEHLARFQATAWREMEATLPPLPRLPPLLACSVLGPVPFWATFVAPVAADDATLEDLLHLACNLDAAHPAPGDLADAPPEVAARVLARALTLLPTTIEYVPDVALAAGAADASGAGATPDAPPRRPRGTMPTNTFDDATATWTGDCEDQAALAVAVWRAMAESRAAHVRALVGRFRAVVLALTVVGGGPGAFHVCGALLPRAPGAAALLEGVVRTCGVPVRGETYRAPVGAEQRAERPLVLLPDGSLNRWYDRVVFAVDTADPTVMLLPFVDDRGGGTVAQLLAGDVDLRPLNASIPELLARRILQARNETPAVDLRAVRVQPGAGAIDARRPMEHAPDAPADAAAVHVPDVLRNPHGSWFIL